MQHFSPPSGLPSPSKEMYRCFLQMKCIDGFCCTFRYGDGCDSVAEETLNGRQLLHLVQGSFHIHMRSNKITWFQKGHMVQPNKLHEIQQNHRTWYLTKLPEFEQNYMVYMNLSYASDVHFFKWRHILKSLNILWRYDLLCESFKRIWNYPIQIFCCAAQMQCKCKF